MHLIHRFAAPLILVAGVLVAALVVILSGALPVAAQEGEIEVEIKAKISVTFPVAELGNCESKEACKQYCNNPDNIEACVAFAESHGLMQRGDAEIAKKFARTVKTAGGPGGCTGPESCRAYCENIDHLEECLAFAEEHGHSDANVQEGRKIAQFLKSGGQLPGGCNSRQSCEQYCSEGDHMEECIAFAERAGLEVEGPEGHKVGIEQMKRVHAMMKSGETPGSCKSKQECESFCQNPDNSEQCLAFAERAGFMPKEEIERARKFMQEGGPGGCRGREACESFCQNPENQETCMAFAEQHGMMRPEDAQRMREMRSMLKEGPREHEGPDGGGPGIGECVRGKIQETMASGQRPDMQMMQGVVQECMTQTGNPGQFGGPEMHQEGFGGEGFGEQGFGGEAMPAGRRGMEGRMPPRMMGRPEGDMPRDAERGSVPRPDDFKQQYQERYRQQFNQQFDQQYKQQFEQKYRETTQNQGGMPGQIPFDMKPGMEPRMQGGMMPQNMTPEQYRQQYGEHSQPDGSMTAPTNTMMPPPPPDGTQSNAKLSNMLANVLVAIFSLYGVR